MLCEKSLENTFKTLSLHESIPYQWIKENTSLLHWIMKEEHKLHEYIHQQNDSNNNTTGQYEDTEYSLFHCDCIHTLRESEEENIISYNRKLWEEHIVMQMIQHYYHFSYWKIENELYIEWEDRYNTLYEVMNKIKNELSSLWMREYMQCSHYCQNLLKTDSLPSYSYKIVETLDNLFSPLSSPQYNPYFYILLHIDENTFLSWIHKYMKIQHKIYYVEDSSLDEDIEA